MGSATTSERVREVVPGAAKAEQGAPRWYLLQTRARQEQRARDHLKNQGFHCFLPEIDIQARHSGRLITRREALFPGYLFIQLTYLADNWAPIRSTRGVQRIVSFSDTETPPPVSNALVEAIQHRVARPSAAPSAIFSPGDRVFITEGPFANIEAIFDCFNGEKRVFVLLKMLQSAQRMSFPLRSVARRV
ncbi:transcription/translation regulatory transformer protein RfaH [Alcanivorax quisquiliarum]|uniref:Transcription/translation regulatory transformer protein RfaH n=1 Tax=Alcanivorax quisquiliarum TaxID=2933565 RepID=A0ABT0EAD1_9GAMM|nr:transcription/translation regulatory transformer protein RfaH [Alcanivorax quisquiliarum]MCK0538697.1 transcription/translation regulatory transformer protein RfaH [Alcanivorax quisquiliarum]